MKFPILYRGFEIRPGGHWPEHGYSWVHPDYDGPGDNRCGSAATVDECKLDIDEWHEMNPEPEDGEPVYLFPELDR